VGMNSNSNTEYRPLVSIALTTYNGELYLREQLDSLLGQTYNNFEIVITDDGSIDGTVSILSEYAEKDTRISFSQNTRGKGVVLNFTEAVLHCQGEIIFFCDQDDIWYPFKIEKHITAYKDQSIQWVYNEAELIDETGKTIGFLTDKLPDYWTRRKLLYYTWGSCILGCATSYRRDLILPFWPADTLAPGHDSWIQLAIYPSKSFYITEILQDYRQHNKNAVGLPTFNNDFKPNAELAISNNLNYLKSLAKNRRIQVWKRAFFITVLFCKKIRGLLG